MYNISILSADENKPKIYKKYVIYLKKHSVNPENLEYWVINPQGKLVNGVITDKQLFGVYKKGKIKGQVRGKLPDELTISNMSPLLRNILNVTTLAGVTLVTAMFFQEPFAASGDKITIPVPIQVDNTVSYTQGWGPEYQANQLTDPNALDVPRQQTNELMYEITLAIQQYQVNGTPAFITAAQNGGVPWSYDIYSIVRFDPGSGVKLYISLINNNTNDPTDSDAWAQLDIANSGVYIAAATFDGAVAQGDIVYFNSLTGNYGQAIATGSAQQQVQGIADLTNSRVLILGQYPSYSGLTSGAQYYLSGSSAGAYTTTPPTPNVVSLGIAISSTTLQFNAQPIYTPSVNLFTSNTTWTVPYGVYIIYVTGCGGGAGSGGSGGRSNSSSIPGTGGGGGGGAAIGQVYKQLIAVTPGTVLTIQIGAAGTGGSAGTVGGVGGDGTPGGTTVILNGITPLLTLLGGLQGTGSMGATSNTCFRNGGNGGLPGGQPGAPGFGLSGGGLPGTEIMAGNGGNGGSSTFGTGGTPGNGVIQNNTGAAGVPGNDGSGYGAGGGAPSGVSNNNLPGVIGSNGSQGFLIIEY